MSGKWAEVSDYDGRVFFRNGAETLDLWEVEDRLNALQADADRLRTNFEWLDRIERDNGNDGMRRYFKFRQRSEDIGVLAAIEEFRAEEGEAG